LFLTVKLTCRPLIGNTACASPSSASRSARYRSSKPVGQAPTTTGPAAGPGSDGAAVHTMLLGHMTFLSFAEIW
jgi:hypothetical protein